MTKKSRDAKPIDRTNAIRQRRYIKRLKDAAQRPSEIPEPIDGRDLHAIAMAMVRIAELFERMAPPAPRQTTKLERYLQPYISGRWKRRRGDHVQAIDPSGDLRSVGVVPHRHQGGG